jgi:cephalosporin-C deacetylase-like acetyl esterase
MGKQVTLQIRGGSRGIEQTAPTQRADVEILMKRVDAIMNELPYLSNTNRIIRIANVSLQDELMNRIIEIITLAENGYVEQAWKSLRQLCKWVAGMNMATPAMVKVIVG